MGEHNYIEDIKNRVFEKIKIRFGSKLAIAILVTVPLFVSGVIFITTYYLFTPQDAGEFAMQTILFYFGEAIILVYLLFDWRYNTIYTYPQKLGHELR